MDTPNPASTYNQSTDKLLSILELLCVTGQPMRLNEISSKLNFNSSTALRFLNSLERNGYVYKDLDSNKYRMTYKICGLASYVSNSAEIINIASGPIRSLSYSLGECVCLAISQSYQVVYVYVCDGPRRILQSTQRIGKIAPMHATGVGKVLLSDFTEQEIDEMIAERGLTWYTENTITSKDQLLKELQIIKKQGYGFDNQECDLGARCIALPIRDYTDHIIASMSVTGPAEAMTDDFYKVHFDEIKRTADEISARLGYQQKK